MAQAKTKTKAKTKKASKKLALDPGGTSDFKVGNGCVYDGAKWHIKSISGLDPNTGDPEEAVIVPHDGVHEISLVKFSDLTDVVRS